MTIAVGDKIPSVKLREQTDSGITEYLSDEFFAGKKAVLFGLPGAFTPGCSAKHVPGYVEHYDALKAKGVDLIACVSVNDAFVMGAWGKDRHVGDKIHMLADGSAEFTKALGLDWDMTAMGLGVRSKRYALVLEDGVVTIEKIEEGGGVDVSSAESILAAL